MKISKASLLGGIGISLFLWQGVIFAGAIFPKFDFGEPLVKVEDEDLVKLDVKPDSEKPFEKITPRELAIPGGLTKETTSVVEKSLQMDPANSVQHMPNVKIVPETTSGRPYVELKRTDSNVLDVRLDKTKAANFVISQSTNSDITSTQGLNSILGGVDNHIGKGESNAILGGDGNSNEANSSSTILGGRGNSIQDGSNNTVIGGESNSVEGGESSVIAGGAGNTIKGSFSAVVGNNNVVDGDYSVALGNGANVNANNSFLWADGNSTLIDSDGVFAVSAENGMVVNSDKAHSFAKLTIGGPLILDNGSDVECKMETKGVLKVVDGDKMEGTDDHYKCFCSCNGETWNSMFYAVGGCEGKCNTNLKPECGKEVARYRDINPGNEGYCYKGTCEKGDLVEGDGAYFVSKDNKVHWSCETRDGQVALCETDDVNVKVKDGPGDCGCVGPDCVYNCEIDPHSLLNGASLMGPTENLPSDPEKRKMRLYPNRNEASKHYCGYACDNTGDYYSGADYRQCLGADPTCPREYHFNEKDDGNKECVHDLHCKGPDGAAYLNEESVNAVKSVLHSKNMEEGDLKNDINEQYELHCVQKLGEMCGYLCDEGYYCVDGTCKEDGCPDEQYYDVDGLRGYVGLNRWSSYTLGSQWLPGGSLKDYTIRGKRLYGGDKWEYNVGIKSYNKGTWEVGNAMNLPEESGCYFNCKNNGKVKSYLDSIDGVVGCWPKVCADLPLGVEEDVVVPNGYLYKEEPTSFGEAWIYVSETEFNNKKANRDKGCYYKCPANKRYEVYGDGEMYGYGCGDGKYKCPELTPIQNANKANVKMKIMKKGGSKWSVNPNGHYEDVGTLSLGAGCYFNCLTGTVYDATNNWCFKPVCESINGLVDGGIEFRKIDNPETYQQKYEYVTESQRATYKQKYEAGELTGCYYTCKDDKCKKPTPLTCPSYMGGITYTEDIDMYNLVERPVEGGDNHWQYKTIEELKSIKEDGEVKGCYYTCKKDEYHLQDTGGTDYGCRSKWECPNNIPNTDGSKAKRVARPGFGAKNEWEYKTVAELAEIEKNEDIKGCFYTCTEGKYEAPDKGCRIPSCSTNIDYEHYGKRESTIYNSNNNQYVTIGKYENVGGWSDLNGGWKFLTNMKALNAAKASGTKGCYWTCGRGYELKKVDGVRRCVTPSCGFCGSENGTDNCTWHVSKNGCAPTVIPLNGKITCNSNGKCTQTDPQPTDKRVITCPSGWNKVEGQTCIKCVIDGQTKWGTNGCGDN